MQSKNQFAAIFLCLLLMAALLLSACGENESTGKSADDNADTAETTVVLETTSEGGTVEEDAEGNRITKDKEGKIISVVDKNGNPIDLDEYLTTHSWAESNGSSSGAVNEDNGNAGESSGSSTGGKNNSSGNSSNNKTESTEKSDKKDTSGSQGDVTEGEIPVIIATLPENYEDLPELPDL